MQTSAPPRDPTPQNPRPSPRLNPPDPAAYNSATTLYNHAEVLMPHYEFFCHACKKTFSKILALADHEVGRVTCPHCGSHKVEQCWSAFSAITSRKSA